MVFGPSAWHVVSPLNKERPMLKKPFVMILLVAALILSTTAVSASAPPQQIDLKAQAKSLLAQKYAIPADSLRQVGRAPLVRYPMQGLVIQEFKFIDAQGESYGIALNAGGQEVDVARLDAAEKAAYEAKYGKLDPQLRKALALARPEDRVEVDIWLKMPETSHA